MITKYQEKQLIKKAKTVEAVEKENNKIKAKNSKLENRNVETQESNSVITKQLTSTKEDTKRVASCLRAFLQSKRVAITLQESSSYY